MLITLNQLTGMPAVWHGQEVGQVERGVADEAARRLLGLIIRRGLGAAKWVPSQGIALVGQHCIVINQRQTSLPGDLPENLGRVYLTSGSLTGEVTDGVLSAEDLRLVALEVSAGPLYRLMGQRAYATDYQVRRDGLRDREVVAANLLSWAEMNHSLEEEKV